MDAGITNVVQAHPTSSAEYVVMGIKQHKLAVIVVVLVICRRVRLIVSVRGGSAGR